MRDFFNMDLASRSELGESGVDELPKLEALSVKPKRIMLIEATAAIGELISEVLTQETNYEVQWIHDGQAFLQAIDDGVWPPDLLILDVTSLINDYKYLIQNAVADSTDLPPVIIMSSWTSAYAKEVLGPERAGSVLVKPFDVDTLLERVRRVLENGNDKKRPPTSENIPSTFGHQHFNTPTVH